MDIGELQLQWNEFGKTDPLYAILTYKGALIQKSVSRQSVVAEADTLPNASGLTRTFESKLRAGDSYRD